MALASSISQEYNQKKSPRKSGKSCIGRKGTGKWTAAEEDMLTKLVLGSEGSWKTKAARLQTNRSEKAVRQHWMIMQASEVRCDEGNSSPSADGRGGSKSGRGRGRDRGRGRGRGGKAVKTDCEERKLLPLENDMLAEVCSVYAAVRSFGPFHRLLECRLV